MSKWFIWDTEDCPRRRTESGDNNGRERGFSIPALKARTRELSRLIAIQSKLGATRLQDVPDGSSQAQREQRGWVCVQHSTGPANQPWPAGSSSWLITSCGAG